MGILQEVAGLASRLVMVELKVGGLLAAEKVLRREARRVMARQGDGQPGQQELELERDGEGGAVQGPGVRVGQEVAPAGVDQARPERLGEVGPVRRAGELLTESW